MNNAPQRPLKIAYLTAGAAGMYCGSCMHDNTLARGLIELGHDVQLIPLYTPIRTDEVDVSMHRVFFGGINMYLQQRLSLFRFLPKWVDSFIDQPWLIRLATSFGISTDAKQLGALAVSVLRGEHGFQAKEVDALADWLVGDLKPDILNLTNVLVAGCVPAIKRRFDVPVVTTLQGDDIFLRDLPEPYHSQALAEIAKLAEQIDAFIVNSVFYADFMSQYLGIPREKFRIVPLGVDAVEFGVLSSQGELAMQPPRNLVPTVGYLARLAPEKGLHVLAEAFILLRKLPGMQDARLRIAGWLGKQHQPYIEGIFKKLRAAGLGEAFEYVGEVDRAGKLALLRSIDVLAVPTTYREPKGIFVLEALAAGVPVVQPDHGSFPEMLADLQGGLLHRPEDAQHLAERLHELLSDAPRRREMAIVGQANVHARRNRQVMSQRTLEVLQEFVRPARAEA
jgi:glycosyltransferase involved in cell wall biosynthesis